jgi:hypothetical protein
MRRALCVLALFVAGCSSGQPDSSTATATHDKAVKFAECMRDNGVAGFPDPDASGALTIDGVLNGSSIDPNSAAWKSAIGACKKLQPAGFTGNTVKPAQRKPRLAFAQCIRDNGVPDFPDPTPEGPLVDTNRIPSAATAAGMNALNAAMHKCGAVYADQLGLTGR